MKEKGKENEYMHKEMVEKDKWVKQLFYNIIIHQNIPKIFSFQISKLKSILTKMPYTRL